MSVLLSRKIDQDEFLIDEEILPSAESRITKQANFTYSILGKAFEKQIKTSDNQGINQVAALKPLTPA